MRFMLYEFLKDNYKEAEPNVPRFDITSAFQSL